jgi:hypothetical protein
MAFRFQRRVKIMPGVRLNVSKSGVSASVGTNGATVNVGKDGVTRTVGVPGTGLSHRKTVVRRKKAKGDSETSSGVLGWIAAILVCLGVLAGLMLLIPKL